MPIPPPPPPPSADNKYYPPTGFYFSVQVATDRSESDIRFQEVSGISAKISTEELAEGGENRFKHKLPAPPSHTNLVLKRGLLLPVQPLFTWCKETIMDGFAQTIQRKTIVVSLLGNPTGSDLGEPIKQWNIKGAWPVSWEISNFNSQENQIVVESLEFAYDYFEVLK